MSEILRIARSDFEGGADDLLLTDQEYQLFLKFFRNVMLLPREFKSWIPDWVALTGLDVPVSQLQGFTQFQARYELLATEQTTQSVTYTNLLTTGPTLTGLPDGIYLVSYGAAGGTSGTNAARMSIEVNAAAAADADAIFFRNASPANGSTQRQKTLNNGGNNTITAKYRIGNAAETATFHDRWLSIQKIANL